MIGNIITVIALLAVLGACVYEWWQIITDRDLCSASYVNNPSRLG